MIRIAQSWTLEYPSRFVCVCLNLETSMLYVQYTEYSVAFFKIFESCRVRGGRGQKYLVDGVFTIHTSSYSLSMWVPPSPPPPVSNH